MKKLLLFTVLIAGFIACKKDHDSPGSLSALPGCIQDMIADTSVSNHLFSIQRTTVGQEQHYWLNSGAAVVDGPEYIINEQCDTVCYWRCFCQPPPCADIYNSSDFEIVWQK